jgi:apolipoprotein N-acyltransferase
LIGPWAGDFTHSRQNVLVAMTGAAGWVALEWVRGWLFTGFGWNQAGVALHGSVPMIQVAEWTGVGGLSFVVALTNLTGALTLRRFAAEAQRGRVRAHWDFSLNMALIAALIGYGLRQVVHEGQVKTGTTLAVALVQPNFSEVQKADPAFEPVAVGRLAYLTETALQLQPQLVVWPECAMPRGMFASEGNFQQARSFAARVDFLLGTLDFDEENGGHDYNAAVLLTEGGQSIQSYRKMHLVPFGEYIPFRNSFPLFRWVVGDLVPYDLTPGKAPVVMTMKRADVRLGALVCFEDTLGELTRRFVQGGAQLLVNVTNDGWFLQSAGSEQHLANAIFRAVENRRPLIRAANTGVSAFIDPLGRATQRLVGQDGSTFTEGVLNGGINVPPADERRTFYTRHGEWFAQACAALATVAVAWGIRCRRKESRA